MTPTASAPTCASCANAWKQHSGGGWMCGRREATWNPVSGYRTLSRTCESERTRFWRWFGADTCGPEGRYWQEQAPLGSPPGRQPPPSSDD